MLIIPVENKPDWRHPPVVTLLIVLVNVWVYFALLAPDETTYVDARRSYVAGGLIEREAEHFRVYYHHEYQDEHRSELPNESESLIDYVLLDLGFDSYLKPHLAEDPAWRRARDAFERRRNEMSWIRFGLIPAEGRWWSYASSMFLHGSVDHLLGNMAFLFIFGFALERVLGAARYGAVYMLGGLAGGAVYALVHAGSHISAIGASGAVSALMGAYLAVYRLRRIRFFYSILVYFGELRAPALLILPLWLLKELYGSLYGAEGIAYWDHIGGLAAGALLGWLAMAGSRRVDTDYLDSAGRETASRAAVERLDALIDEFKFDHARAVAVTHLVGHPDDAATWMKYLKLVSADKDDPEYHKAVKRLLSLAGSNPGADTSSLIERTYREYRAGPHPKPALNDPRLLGRLGELFARRRQLGEARRIANGLLKANRREPEVARLLRALCTGLSEAGSGALAEHYRNELSVRFPEAS